MSDSSAKTNLAKTSLDEVNSLPNNQSYQELITWSRRTTALYSCQGDLTDVFIFRLNFPRIQTLACLVVIFVSFLGGWITLESLDATEMRHTNWAFFEGG